MDTMKGESPNIYDVLFEKNICFAVCISPIQFRCDDFDMFSKNYFVIINYCDAESIESDFIFYETETYRRVFERKLSDDDVKDFKKIIDKFVKVKKNIYGCIYELRDNSFKTYFGIQKEKYTTDEIISGFWW